MVLLAGVTERAALVGDTHPKVWSNEPSAGPAEPCEQLLPPCWEAQQSQFPFWSGDYSVLIQPPVGTELEMGVLWAVHSLRPLPSPGNKEISGGLGFSLLATPAVTFSLPCLQKS